MKRNSSHIRNTEPSVVTSVPTSCQVTPTPRPPPIVPFGNGAFMNSGSGEKTHWTMPSTSRNSAIVMITTATIERRSTGRMNR